MTAAEPIIIYPCKKEPGSFLPPSQAPARGKLPYHARRVLAVIVYNATKGRFQQDVMTVFSLEAACGKFGRSLAVDPQGWM